MLSTFSNDAYRSAEQIFSGKIRYRQLGSGSEHWEGKAKEYLETTLLSIPLHGTYFRANPRTLQRLVQHATENSCAIYKVRVIANCTWAEELSPEDLDFVEKARQGEERKQLEGPRGRVDVQEFIVGRPHVIPDGASWGSSFHWQTTGIDRCFFPVMFNQITKQLIVYLLSKY